MLLKTKINSGKLIITKLFPYTSHVHLKLHEVEKSLFEKNKDLLSIIEEYKRRDLMWLYRIWARFAHIIDKVDRNLIDNKIAMEFHLEEHPGQKLYIGNYDNKLSLGLSVYQHPNYKRKPIHLNIKL